jgi:hypothetical protein
VKWPVAVEKPTLSKFAEISSRKGAPINAVLDFRGHFLSLGGDGFSKEVVFQQPRLVSTVIALSKGKAAQTSGGVILRFTTAAG